MCVGASLILGGHWLGLIPDNGPIVMRARQNLSEAIAVNSAAHVRKQQWVDLRTTLETLVDRDDELLSIGVRSDTGMLRVDTGHHAKVWEKVEDENAEVESYAVPVTLNRRPWGKVEVCFVKPNQTYLDNLMLHPLLRLVVFFAATGMIAYTIFVAKIFRLFNKTQVVPERVRQALDTLAEGLLVLDEEQRIVLANRAFAETVGMTNEDLVNQAVAELPWLATEGAQQEPYPWSTAIECSAVQTESMLRFKLESGNCKIFSVNAAPLGNDGVQRGALVTFRDVTEIEEHRVELESMLSMLRSSRDEIERKNAELEVLATQDALTGCLNRRAFFDRFETLWQDAHEHDRPLSCIMIDNDHFKNVNDTYGHHVGDEVLRQVARVMRERHHDNGLVCRYGGEEFCVVLPNITFEQAIEEAELTRIAISEITFPEQKDLLLTASLGVSETRFEPLDPQDMINQADVCLYTAKRNGRNCVVPYNTEMSSDDLAETPGTATRKPGRIEIPYRAVTALVSALSYRDANTAEHSRRVSELCTRAADGLLDRKQTFILEVAALLHDIGKVGVPDHILLKPGALTDEEWEIMSRHDRIGVEIVASAFDCPLLTEIMGCHHAFFGGKGRDVHLPSGQDIPVGARLLTICDSYDAMVSDRVYRKGRSHDDAIVELRRCAGTQFDPELVEHFAQKITGQPLEKTASPKNHPAQAAIQIGYQVERLAHAVSSQDADGMKMLAARLGMYARNCDIDSIADAAERIEQQVDTENIQWIELLRETHELMDICRAAQSTILRESLAEDSIAASEESER
ncbi:MAG: diguanylate cyclase [Pirellulaceae bacterium]|nr:diguanylate cyclase [Pirellulaceae bacterium]